MSLSRQKLQILTILSENLRNPAPQLVPTEALARQVDMGQSELAHVLRTMDDQGDIQTDPDLQFSLITRQGLLFLEQQAVTF